MKLYRRIAWFVAFCAVASCWNAARADGIQVLQKNVKVGKTSQNVLKCIPPIRCSVEDNAVVIGSDGGTAAAATDAGTGWTTDLDCDLTAQTPQGLDAGTASNSAYPICGKNFYSFKHDSLLAANQPDLTANGIIITPAQSTSLGGNAPPCPGFYLKLSEVISDFDTSTRWRASMHWTANFTTSGDEVSFTEYGWQDSASNTVSYFFGLRNGYNTTVGASPTYLYWATGSWGGDTVQYAPRSAGGGIGNYLDSSRNLGTLEAERGSGAGVRVSADWADGGAFPHVGALGGLTAPTIGVTVQNNGGQQPILSSGTAGVWLLFCAQRNGNVHAGFKVQFKRIKVEHKL